MKGEELTVDPQRPQLVAYLLVALLLVLMVWLHLGTFLVAALFGYLALQTFRFRGSKAVSVLLYGITALAIGCGLLYSASLAYRTLPKIAETSIPAMVEFAERNGIELPFTDYPSLKASALTEARQGITVIGRYARIASLNSVLLVAGLVVALTFFLNPSWTVGPGSPPDRHSLFVHISQALADRFATLYSSVVTVIGAQILIAAINTALTAVFLLVCRFPYAILLISLVFLCGLVPIVGNLISNLLIVGVGFTLSPTSGLLALVFLIVIHKLEYLMNSKIIGARINSPVWLTLVALLLGERLMGISGMILAPVFLHYLRLELSARPAQTTTASSA